MASAPHLVPIECRQLGFAIELQGYWNFAEAACCTVQQRGLALVQLLVQVEVLHTPAFKPFQGINLPVNSFECGLGK